MTESTVRLHVENEQLSLGAASVNDGVTNQSAADRGSQTQRSDQREGRSRVIDCDAPVGLDAIEVVECVREGQMNDGGG